MGDSSSSARLDKRQFVQTDAVSLKIHSAVNGGSFKARVVSTSYSFVMSVTVPLLISFPLESDTLTTARTTADLSLFS